MTKSCEKDFYVPWYYRQWLSDQQLKMISLAATGLWIHLISQSCDMQIQGVFASEKSGEEIEISDEKFNKKFQNFAKISEEKLLNMFAGKTSEKRRAFNELKAEHVIKQSSDGTYYVKVIYRFAQLRELRRAAGKQGGNPKLVEGFVGDLDKQNTNQNKNLDNQNLNQKGGYTNTNTNPNPNIDTIPQCQSHSLSCNEGANKGGFGDDDLYKKNLLDLGLMRRIASAKGKLVTSIENRLGPQNGTRLVMSDIVELAVHKAIAAGDVGVINNVMGLLRKAAESSADNPTGLFVAACKKKLGYLPRGKIL